MRVLALGSSPHTVLAVTRSLARRGAAVVLGVPDTAPCPAAMSRHCRQTIRVPAPERPDLVPFLVDRLARDPVDVILPLGDTWLQALASQADAFRGHAALAMAPSASVAWALDKGRTVAAWPRDRWPSGAHPLPPPLTSAPADAADAVEQWRFGYPAIVKPRTASGAEGIRLVCDAAELRAAYGEVERAFPRPLVQEFVDYAPKDKFMLLYLFDAEGDLRARYMHRMVEEQRAIRGADGARRRGGVSLVWRSVFDADLLARGETLLRAAEWRGFAEVECVRARDDPTPRLMEVNARFPGTIGLALREGVEFAWGACLVALGRVPPTQLDMRAGARGRQDWLTLLTARQWRAVVRELDPGVAGANPFGAELALVRAHAGRLLRKHLTGRASGRPVLPAAGR